MISFTPVNGKTMTAMLVAALTAFFVGTPYESVLLYQDILRMNALLSLFCVVGAAVILGIPPPGGRVPLLWYYHHEVADNRFDIPASLTCRSIAQNGRAGEFTYVDAYNSCVFRRTSLWVYSTNFLSQ
eukprot:TsM_001245300 transcript=TsM_001245300 gene=TsM_001245300